jgi:hypothetical protein
LGHALIVMASSVLSPHLVRVADEEGPNLLVFAKLDHLPGRLMAQIAHTSFEATRHFIPGALQFSPPARVFLTPGLLLGKLSVAHVALAFEAANAPALR